MLPAIRKHGGYIAQEKELSPEELMAKALMVAQKTIQERDSRISELSATNEVQAQRLAEYEPKMDYLSRILESRDTVTVTQIAADYGMSARKLNEILHEEGIQHRVNDQWILYRKHMGGGYTRSNTVHFTRSDGTADVKMVTRWTQKGRLMIHQLLEKRGITAVMDRHEKEENA